MKERSDPEFIRDQAYAPFQDDIILITKVQTANELDLDLNVLGNPWSITTTKANVLEVPRRIVDKGVGVPDWLQTDRLLVTYRQGHPKILPGAGEYDGNRVEIDIPETHKQALLYFVASAVHNPIGMGQEFNAGNTYFAKYMAEVQTLKEDGMYIDQADQGTKFESKGFR